MLCRSVLPGGWENQMTTTESTYLPALASPDFDSFAVRQAIAGFLAGYGETTREAYGSISGSGCAGARRTSWRCLR